MTNLHNNPTRTWKCFICGTEYRNTLLYCPRCNIARKHSFTLENKANKKRESRKKELTKKICELYRLPKKKLHLKNKSVEDLENIIERLRRFEQ